MAQFVAENVEETVEEKIKELKEFFKNDKRSFDACIESMYIGTGRQSMDPFFATYSFEDVFKLVISFLQD